MYDNENTKFRCNLYRNIICRHVVIIRVENLRINLWEVYDVH